MPSTPTVQPLTFRLEKGTPLTAAEGDENLRILRDAQNSALALMGVALNPDGTLKSPPIVFGNSTTGTDAYLITPTPAVESSASLIGRLIVMIPNFTNAGAATLEITGLAAQAIKKFYNQPLETGDIKAGQSVVLSWDGANYQMQSWPGVVQPTNYALDVGTPNEPSVVYAAGSTTSVPAALYAGFEISVKITAANTGASNLHIGALSAAIKKNFNNALAAGDLAVGQIAKFVYDGTNFQLVSPVPKTMAALTAQNLPAAAGVLTFPHGFGVVPTYFEARLVCVTGESGYNAGNEVLVSSAWLGDTSDIQTPISVLAGTGSVQVIFSSDSLRILNATTGALATLTRANWQVKVYIAP